ncbi:MAG: hypothetical protein LBT18_04355 [Endomicrobium sp.]|nr:hypothetical protein [Endomicrobium sp.]
MGREIKIEKKDEKKMKKNLMSFKGLKMSVMYVILSLMLMLSLSVPEQVAAQPITRGQLFQLTEILVSVTGNYECGAGIILGAIMNLLESNGTRSNETTDNKMIKIVPGWQDNLDMTTTMEGAPLPDQMDVLNAAVDAYNRIQFDLIKEDGEEVNQLMTEVARIIVGGNSYQHK